MSEKGMKEIKLIPSCAFLSNSLVFLERELQSIWSMFLNIWFVNWGKPWRKILIRNQTFETPDKKIINSGKFRVLHIIWC